ncbi:Hsp70 family protein [Pelagibius sp. 7325]|uniref:Hsp70 family protein n=1 Tax=Pelagibius sp. 7325 TaxID=3131994 RepID=UPI0030EE0BCA
MNSIVAGLDFGTSNSAIGFATDRALQLHRFERGGHSVPTALFYDEDEAVLVCGHEAEARFLDGHEGRYLRALKSILGTSLAEESTRMGRRAWPLRALLAHFLTDLKSSAERSAGAEISRLVAGRPVRFVDEDDKKDAEAEALLRDVLEKSGYSEVRFVYEPVAALIDAEANMGDPKYVLVADIGGGTSDFSVAHRSAGRSSHDIGGFEILANHGVHIGGTDLDRRLSLKAVMPMFGYGSEMRALTSDDILPVPPRYYRDLATWQKIHFCYTQALRREVREVMGQALEPQKIAHLLMILERRLGHRLANAVERVKIALSDNPTARLNLPDFDGLGAIDVSQAALSQYFEPQLERIGLSVGKTLELAGVPAERIDHIVLTGGSTLLPEIRRTILDVVPNARLVPSDPFSAVAKGLTKAAQRAYLAAPC